MSDRVDLYATLGLTRGAKPNEIRTAYKRLAMQYHPDKNPAGGDKFKAVCEAYRILNDPEQKAIYDSGAQRPSLRDLQRELNRELAGRELHDWVSDLMRAEREAQQQRADFERRRRAEMQRRADFDREYGGKRSAPAPRGPGALGPGGPRWRNGCVDTPELADPMPFAPKPPGQAAGGTAVPEASPPQGPRESGARPQHSDSLKRHFMKEYRMKKKDPMSKVPDPMFVESFKSCSRFTDASFRGCGDLD
uniref:J domain-containing protein n=1 Tax=Eutreptiella gymnastica TaxID=73025 RepID=A0A7S4FQU2_9EUGL|mmetsp:Transcript_27647/g.46873  ORF Transcript_27647/g.46873 Transcript_27647/m.46873 type:complete len:249 (-) Transcript_27647:1984-2730(-)|eukprot:CAMPEP_0174343586 /NCGR_PEP_ID=MMETSP0810-20121108/27071_1 /TAXON_ID=73025 ORGANISM="Eutreptiella gymnastica-like, Strain CCMP1594" /NCGR_SAMPLE_ID=MMETSP0810 /ASSEMBLY_ACC=CAM_ASM_000659 /LENGTH=248 /DNA_ID=CAMNT_0015466393 /DNA_START=45 /DNA_END=791 /DNA_ORIENTATION=-